MSPSENGSPCEAYPDCPRSVLYTGLAQAVLHELPVKKKHVCGDAHL